VHIELEKFCDHGFIKVRANRVRVRIIFQTQSLAAKHVVARSNRRIPYRHGIPRWPALCVVLYSFWTGFFHKVFQDTVQRASHDAEILVQRTHCSLSAQYAIFPAELSLGGQYEESGLNHPRQVGKPGKEVTAVGATVCAKKSRQWNRVEQARDRVIGCMDCVD
jgi:hypothetical protein